MTVHKIWPTLEHHESCDRDVYGRATLSMVRDLTFISRRAIIDYVREWRATHTCGCLALRIAAAETAHATAKKRFEASLSDENADTLANAEDDLKRLRSLQS